MKSLAEIAQSIVDAHTAEELAEAAGVPKGMAALWKKGGKTPSVKHLDLLIGKWPEPCTAESIASGVTFTCQSEHPIATEERPSPPKYDPIPEGVKVMIMTPSASGMSYDLNNHSLNALVAKYPDKLTRAEPQPSWNLFWARNRLMHRWLASGVPWGLYVDADMVVPCGQPEWLRSIMPEAAFWGRGFAEVHALDRLLTTARGKGTNDAPERPIMSAVYFKRDGSGDAVFHAALNNRIISQRFHNEGPRDEIIPAGNFSGFGCILIHRSVPLAIMDKLPQYRVHNGHEKPWLGYDYDFFRQLGDESDDAAFCLKAVEVGHKTWVDCAIVCGHIGLKVWGNRPAQ